MIVFVTEAYTPVEFVSQRYHVYVKRKREGRLRGKVSNHKEDHYGLMLPDAQALAQQWASLLNCEVIGDEKTEVLLRMQPARHGP